MAFNQPPNTPPGPQAPPVPSGTKTLADVSAAGTTQGAPVTQISKGPPTMPGQAPAPAVQGAGVAPPPQRQVVGRHANAPSVGTCQSGSPLKQGNPTHGMADD